MIQREKIEELLNLSVDERREVLRLLQESLSAQDQCQSSNKNDLSPAATWVLSMAGRYSGGPGNTARQADEILRAELGKPRNSSTN